MTVYQARLQNEYEKALQMFEEAKTESIRALENLDVCHAVDFGAGYAAKIDQVTAAAAKVKALGDQLRIYDYLSRRGDAENEQSK